MALCLVSEVDTICSRQFQLQILCIKSINGSECETGLQLVGERERDVLAPTLEIREQKRVLSLAEWEKHK